MKDKTVIASVVVLVVLVAIGAIFISPSISGGTIVYSEEPLQKNSRLSLAPGETFVYNLTMGNVSANVTYSTGEGDGCLILRHMESVNFSGACLDKGGMDDKGFNTTVGSAPVLMFAPWMLALKEGWKWSNTMYLVIGGVPKRISHTDYRVLRLENYSGRQAYVVELKSEGAEPDYDWVDAEYRILLRMSGSDYEVRLMNASGLGNAGQNASG
jgi:hypothetical protein